MKESGGYGERDKSIHTMEEESKCGDCLSEPCWWAKVSYREVISNKGKVIIKEWGQKSRDFGSVLGQI